MIKSGLIILILFLTCATFSQSEPALIDEFSAVPCDDLRARLDGFLQRLTDNPNATGYIMVFGKHDDMRANVFYEEMMRSYFRRRRIDSDRVRFVRSRLKTSLAFEFWIVFPGGVLSNVSRTEWSFRFAPNEKAYKFTWENNYDDICPEVDGVKLFADFLKANPTARGNIVVRQTTKKDLRRKTEQVLSDLTKNYGILRSRLRIFQRRETPDGVNQSVEYWLVP